MINEQKIIDIIKSSLKRKYISWQDKQILRYSLEVDSDYTIMNNKKIIPLLKKAFPNVSSKTIISRFKKLNDLIFNCPAPPPNTFIEDSCWKVVVDTASIDFVQKNFLLKEKQEIPLLDIGEKYFTTLGYVMAPTIEMAKDIAKVTLGPRAWEKNTRFFRCGITTKEKLNDINKAVIQDFETCKTYLQKERERNEWQMDNLEASIIYLKEFISFNG